MWESSDKDFRSAPRCFWKTVRHLRKGKQGTIQAVYSKDGMLLTSTEEVVGWWKKHFDELLNPTMSSTMEAEPEADDSISLGEVTEVVKQLRIDEIRPEILKDLVHVYT